MNKGFAPSKKNVSGPVFSDDSVQRELELINGAAAKCQWISPTGEMFSIELPHTVYPPREDTTFLAEHLFRLGPGRGRKCLEIGTGSGVLALFCHRQGWKVSACDINPYSVASARRLFSENSALEIIVKEGGPGPKTDGDFQQWSDGQNYELIFWNMPYIIPDIDDGSHLGPLEDAALIDTSNATLFSAALAQIRAGSILSSTGLAMFTIGDKFDVLQLDKIAADHGFACRLTGQLKFDDGECLRLVTVWHPFASAPTIHKKITESTNSELLSNDWPTGTSISADYQTAGRGRYSRPWVNSSQSVACSWKIGQPQNMTPATLQIICGCLVKQSLESFSQSNTNSEIVLKWPNDIMIKTPNRAGKVCGILVESTTKGNKNQTVVGIGINLSSEGTDPPHEFAMAFADWYSSSITSADLRQQIDCRIAGLFESKDGIPATNFKQIQQTAFDMVTEGFSKPSQLFYRNKEVKLNRINPDGTIELISHTGDHVMCDEGEHLEWLFL